MGVNKQKSPLQGGLFLLKIQCRVRIKMQRPTLRRAHFVSLLRVTDVCCMYGGKRGRAAVPFPPFIFCGRSVILRNRVSEKRRTYSENFRFNYFPKLCRHSVASEVSLLCYLPEALKHSHTKPLLPHKTKHPHSIAIKNL